MSATITNGNKVTFHFTMFSMQGDVLGSSIGKDPLSYVHGVDPIEPPGLSEHLEGKLRGGDDSDGNGVDAVGDG